MHQHLKSVKISFVGSSLDFMWRAFDTRGPWLCSPDWSLPSWEWQTISPSSPILHTKEPQTLSSSSWNRQMLYYGQNFSQTFLKLETDKRSWLSGRNQQSFFLWRYLCIKFYVFLQNIWPKEIWATFKTKSLLFLYCRSQFFIAAFPGFIAQFLGLYDFHVL